MNKEEIGKLFDSNYDMTYETALTKEVTPAMNRNTFIEVVYELIRPKTIQEQLDACRSWQLTDEELKGYLEG